MCGRFSLDLDPTWLERRLGAAPPDDLAPRYNIHPDARILAVRARPDGSRSAGWVRWGLLPPWSRDLNDKGRQINARFETFLDKPMFKDAGLRYRCLIPATGFFEWQKRAGGNRPWHIGRADGEPLLFAGIFRPTRLEDGVTVTAAILTQEAWPGLKAIHHRMPVMLDDDAAVRWLEPGLDADAVKAALAPLPGDALKAHPVSRRVNSPANDGQDLIRPVDADANDDPPAAQGALL